MKLVPYYKTSSALPTSNSAKDSSFVWIALAVLFGHLVGTWLIFYTSEVAPIKEQRQKVLVKTVQLSPKTQMLTPVSQAQKAPEKQMESLVAVQEPVLEPRIEIEPKKVQPAETPPLAVPVKIEEPTVTPPKPIVETKPVAEPKVIKEEPKKPSAVVPKKEVKIEDKKHVANPKPSPKPVPKPVVKKPVETPKKTVNQAPVKKPNEEVKKPAKEVKKEPTAEEIAAKEAEKIKQKEKAAAQEAEKAKQREIAAAKEAARAEQQALLASAKEKLAKLSESSSKLASTKISSLDSTSIPKQLANLQIDALPVGSGVSMELGAKEISYRDEVAFRIKTALKLPDYGAVKMKLTLNRNGKVSSVQMISSESGKNKDYVERTVPTLIFPDFGTRFGDAAQYTFLITLNNDN